MPILAYSWIPITDTFHKILRRLVLVLNTFIHRHSNICIIIMLHTKERDFIKNKNIMDSFRFLTYPHYDFSKLSYQVENGSSSLKAGMLKKKYGKMTRFWTVRKTKNQKKTRKIKTNLFNPFLIKMKELCIARNSLVKNDYHFTTFTLNFYLNKLHRLEAFAFILTFMLILYMQTFDFPSLIG